MTKIALLPSDIQSRGKYLCEKKLPDNYMADFTLMGFVVDSYPKALEVLRLGGYSVEEQEGGVDIIIHTTKHLPAIQALFTDNDIKYDYKDIADTLYQA